MQIGIITFHRAVNYGAVLQAFALRNTLSKFGCNAEIIDYRNPIIEKMYYYPSFIERNGVKSKIKYILQGKSEISKRKKFESFRNVFLNTSKTIYDCENIDKSDEVYDKFLTGSDQVWNYNAHNFDEAFFLSFVKAREKKYSYAASFGISEIPADKKENYFRLLNDYSVCSVREKNGIKILNDLGIENGRTDIDPSMLIDSGSWKKELNIKPIIRNKYIFVYYFELTESLKKFTEELSKKTGLTVLYFGHTIKKPFNCRCTSVKDAGPLDFVSAISGAEYVVTNSFHGTAFSIIFNKLFFVELLKSDAKVNSRLINILDTFGLNGRLIGNNEKYAEHIEWPNINKKLTELREASYDYLRSIIYE